VDPNFQANRGNPFGGGGFEGFQGFSYGDGSFHINMNVGGMDPDDLFQDFFGGFRRNRGPRRGSDLEMHVRIPFMEAVSGTKRDLKVRYNVLDRESGQYRVKEREVTVDIPAGIDNGMNLRLAGKGADGDPGAPPGNLLVRVIVDQHDYFVREGEDIHTPLSIDFVTAILGGTVDVRTLNGTVEMKIPRGCQPDTKMMLRGKGIRGIHGSGVGNQIVHIAVEIPKSITPYQEELLRKFNGEGDEKESSTDSLSGIGKAAESAFEKLFGKTKEGGTGKEGDNASAKKEVEEEEEEDEKKRAAS
jgi:molecular chaperone DnaJ